MDTEELLTEGTCRDLQRAIERCTITANVLTHDGQERQQLLDENR